MAGASAGALRRCWRPPRSVTYLRCQGPSVSVRGIRTGFFPEDEDYIDPEGPLLADRINARWRYMDDPSLSSTVLERSNVGMGMLVLNRERGLDLPTINDMYVRLRNLEVNSFKRFVGLAATEPGPFCAGLDKMELLLIATCARFHRAFPAFGRALLWHSQELAHLVADYHKPVVCHVSGTAANSGAALACLASHCGVHKDSEMVVDACRVGLVPDGGMTHILGSLQWHLGEFLALTGWTLRGADLVYCGLARHWLAPEALPFLELTAEKQLEVSEADARALLDEHSLPLPEGMRDGDSLPRLLVPLISEVFGKLRVREISEELERQASKINGILPDVLERFRERAGREIRIPTQGVPVLPHIPEISDHDRVDVEKRLERLGRLKPELVDNLSKLLDQLLNQAWRDLEPIFVDLRRHWQPSAPLSEASLREVSECIDQAIQHVESRRGRLTKEVERAAEEAVQEAAQEAVQEAMQEATHIKTRLQKTLGPMEKERGRQGKIEKFLDGLEERVKHVKDISSRYINQMKDTSEKEFVEVLDEIKAFKDQAMQKVFLEICRQRMDQASPLALCATLVLIREARTRENGFRQIEKSKATENSKTKGMSKRIGGLHPAALMESLEMEMRVLQRLLSTQDVVLGLHARCMGVQHTGWSQALKDIQEDPMVEGDVRALMKPLTPGMGKAVDLAIYPRPDISLSQHPRLRRYHPDFDPKTGLDHDPVWMAAEATRWSTDFLAESREAAVRELLGWSRSSSKDPALCGLSRFTRVES